MILGTKSRFSFSLPAPACSLNLRILKISRGEESSDFNVGKKDAPGSPVPPRNCSVAEYCFIFSFLSINLFQRR
jgi:hypothetical protein